VVVVVLVVVVAVVVVVVVVVGGSSLTKSATNASTFDSIAAPSPRLAHPPARSEAAKARLKFSSALPRHFASTLPPARTARR
jgi:hypothetical protein